MISTRKRQEIYKNIEAAQRATMATTLAEVDAAALGSLVVGGVWGAGVVGSGT